MGSSAAAKFCVGCGLNVAGKPRTKNQQGQYYCNPCWAGRAAGSPEQLTKEVSQADDDPLAALAAAVTFKPATLATHEPKEASEHFDEPAEDEEQQDEVVDNLMNCPECGGWFNYAFMSMSGICKRCDADKQLARNRSRDAAVKAAPAKKTQKPEKIQTASARFQFYAGIVCLVVLLGAGVAAILNRDTHSNDSSSSPQSNTPALAKDTLQPATPRTASKSEPELTAREKDIIKLLLDYADAAYLEKASKELLDVDEKAASTISESDSMANVPSEVAAKHLAAAMKESEKAEHDYLAAINLTKAALEAVSKVPAGERDRLGQMLLSSPDVKQSRKRELMNIVDY